MRQSRAPEGFYAPPESDAQPHEHRRAQREKDPLQARSSIERGESKDHKSRFPKLSHLFAYAKPIVFAAACLIVFPAFAQNNLVPVPPIFLGPASAPRLGANVTITFCTSTATGAPCSPLAQAYSDSTNSFPINQGINPLKTDALGNSPVFYAAPGQYSYTVSGPAIGTPQGPYQITVPCIPGVTCAALGAPNVFTNINTFANINKVVYVDQQAGATFDAKYSAACTAITAQGGGSLSLWGFAGTTQSTTNSLSCGSNGVLVTHYCDPSTIFQPATTSANVFTVSQDNSFYGCHGDASNQGSSYTGAIWANASQLITRFYLNNIYAKVASGSTGNCLKFNETNNATNSIEYGGIDRFDCFAATGASGILLQNSSGGYLNNVGWSHVRVYGAQYGVDIEQGGTASIAGHVFSDLSCEASSLATALSCVHLNATGHNGGNDLSANHFYLSSWDYTSGNKTFDITAGSNGFACGNLFVGKFSAVFSDNSTSCGGAAFTKITDLTGASGVFDQTSAMNITSVLSVASGATIDLNNSRPIRWKGAGSTAGNTQNVLNTTDGDGIYVTGLTTAGGNTGTQNIYFYPDGSTKALQINNGNKQFQVNNLYGITGTLYYDTVASGDYRSNGFSWLQNNNGGQNLNLHEETSAPTTAASSEVCYGNSTSHVLLCSYNNGPFFQMAQEITATSSAFATATTAGTCVQNTTAVPGATTSMVATASPVSTPGVGAQWSAFVSSAGNVTINECAVATSAGGTIAFNIRVTP